MSLSEKSEESSMFLLWDFIQLNQTDDNMKNDETVADTSTDNTDKHHRMIPL